MKKTQEQRVVVNILVKFPNLHVSLRYCYVSDIVKFLTNLEMIMQRAEQNKWSPEMFDEKLNQLLTNSKFVYKCPSMNDFWRCHKEIASRFHEK
jgi:hypothetical protein